MKEELSNENINALIAYRFQRAKETLAEIPYLKERGFYNTAVNRLYYGGGNRTFASRVRSCN